jgi:hypothetical protein
MSTCRRHARSGFLLVFNCRCLLCCFSGFERWVVRGCLSARCPWRYCSLPIHLPQDTSLLGLRWLHHNFTCDHGAASATLQQLYLHPDCPTSAMLLPFPARHAHVCQRRAAFLRKAVLLREKKRAVAHGVWDATAGQSALLECDLYAAAASLWQRLADGQQPLRAEVVCIRSLAQHVGRTPVHCACWMLCLDDLPNT